MANDLIAKKIYMLPLSFLSFLGSCAFAPPASGRPKLVWLSFRAGFGIVGVRANKKSRSIKPTEPEVNETSGSQIEDECVFG